MPRRYKAVAKRGNTTSVRRLFIEFFHTNIFWLFATETPYCQMFVRAN